MPDRDVLLVRRTVEPGQVERLRDWLAEVGRREAEAVETLRQEGVRTESAFLREADDATYLYYYLEVDDYEAAMATFEESEHPLDRQHREVMDEVLVDDSAVAHELQYHLTNPER